MNYQHIFLLFIVICVNIVHGQVNQNSYNNLQKNTQLGSENSDFGFPEADVHFELQDSKKNANVSYVLIYVNII